VAHLDWMHAAVAKLEGKQAVCPECAKGMIDWKLVGNPVTRDGYAILWCPVCGRGTYISRMKIRAGLPFAPIGDPVAVSEGVPARIDWIDAD
jgi:hypothetical protein